MGDFSDITKLAGFEFTEHVQYSESGSIIALRGLNIKNGRLILDDVKYIDNSNFSKLNRSKLKEKDIMFTYVGTVGELAIIEENDKFYLAPNVSRIRILDGTSPLFLMQNMWRSDFYQSMISPLIATSSQPALSMDNIRKFLVSLPTVSEQACIGNFFSYFDSLISLHQRKLDNVKMLKKSLLQKLFPKDGEKTPELRFPGFTDAWEQRKLGEVVFRRNTAEVTGALPGVEYEDVIPEEGRLNKDVSLKEATKKGLEFLEGDVLFGKLRPYLKNWLFAEFNGVAVGDWWVLYSDKVDGRLIYYLIQTDSYQTVANLSTGTKMPRSDWATVSQTSFSFPVAVDEQLKIGKYFSSIDSLISLHQRQSNFIKISYLF